MAGGNIPTHVVTLIYLAGLSISASQHLSLLPQPHPCCSEIYTLHPLRGIAVCAGQTKQHSVEFDYLSAFSNAKSYEQSVILISLRIHKSLIFFHHILITLPYLFLFPAFPPFLSKFLPSWFDSKPQGLKIDPINFACSDWFNINAEIVTHQILKPQCCLSLLLSSCSPSFSLTPTELV